jgi:hypothetical protein
MNCLTVCEPYATLIVWGQKPVENRSWAPPRSQVGKRIGIHAGRSKRWLHSWSGRLPAEPQYGAILGTATLAGWFAVGDSILEPDIPERWAWVRGSPHVCGPYCWLLKDVRRLVRPIPCSGALGLWTLAPDVERELTEAEWIRQRYMFAEL